MKRPRPARRALLVIPADSRCCLAAWQICRRAASASTVTVSRGDIESSVTALGTLQPRRYVDVGAQASGQIRQIHVEVGDVVKEGQLLVEIDPSTQKAKLDAGRYSIENLKAQLQEQRAQHQLARRSTSASNAWRPAATREEDVQTAKRRTESHPGARRHVPGADPPGPGQPAQRQAELGYTRIYAPMSRHRGRGGCPRRPDPQRPAADAADPAHRQTVADDRVGRSPRPTSATSNRA
jgi:macrolide-specific efflux system membrane fusion protein